MPPTVPELPPFNVVIPARFGATRLPGKPLLTIAGRTLIERVLQRARASAAAEVVIATDDPRIAAVASALGADLAMTRADHASGSERIAEVVAARGWPEGTIVVNVQGDEPCLPAGLIDQVAGALAADPKADMATLATPITDAAELFDPNCVKLVTGADGAALYFSRAPIPWQRGAFGPGQPPAVLPQDTPFLRHLGLYAYRAGFLGRYVRWPASPLELAESLEQLRVLWHGGRIAVALATARPGPGVDTAEDLARAAAWLAAEAAGAAN